MEERNVNQEEELNRETEGPTQDTPTPEAKAPEAEKQAAYYKDLFLRKAAEFDNFKRRMEVETGSIIRFANEDLLMAILPVLDDLERSLKNSKDAQDSALVKGIELIQQKMLKILEGQGVKPFETVGKEFDVHFHDALLQVRKEGVPPHTIVEEVEKGYLFHEKVLRHAKVIVAADAEDQTVNAGGGEGTGTDGE